MELSLFFIVALRVPSPAFHVERGGGKPSPRRCDTISLNRLFGKDKETMLKKLLSLCAAALALAVNEGSFAADRGLTALKDDARKLRDSPLESLRVMPTVSEKEDYAEPHERLRATDVRGDYDSDAVFANFREVRGGRLKRRSLYRSSIPSSTERPRAPYADRLAREAGIRTVLNLANSPERLKKNMESPACRSPYYRMLWRGGGVIARAMPAAPEHAAFRAGLAEELRFMTKRPAPYLIHCAEGKDRAGFVSFLLAALLDASLDELKNDYGQSFVNYYHLKRGEPRYVMHVDDGIESFCRTVAWAPQEPLRRAAERYLRGIGLTAVEIETLKRRLAQDG